MHVLYLGSFAQPWHTECYIANAFARLGHSVVRLEESTATHSVIVATAAAQRPDLLLLAKARYEGASQGWPADAEPIRRMIAAVRPYVGRVACWLFDLLACEFRRERFDWSRRVAEVCDLFATTDGYTAPRLEHSTVVRQGVPDDCDASCPWRPELRGEVLFLGCPYADRLRLVDALGRRFGGAAGFRSVNNVRGPELTRLVRSFRLVVGPHEPHFAGYWSNRIYVVTGHGGLFAAPTVRGMSDEGWLGGINYLELPLDPRAMAERVAEYLAADDGRLDVVRRAGFEHANAQCSYDARVRELIRRLEASRKNAPQEK
jgi:hypothetical protein